MGKRMIGTPKGKILKGEILKGKTSRRLETIVDCAAGDGK
jgi:hypothetical protein